MVTVTIEVSEGPGFELVINVFLLNFHYDVTGDILCDFGISSDGRYFYIM